MREQDWINISQQVTWGSSEEKKLGERKLELGSSDSLLLYPFVAKLTTRGRWPLEKTENFSVAYAGSIWAGGHRDHYKIFEAIGRQKIDLYVYMANSSNRHNWNLMRQLQKTYPTIKLFPAVDYYSIKDVLSQHHAGLVVTNDQFMKTRFTFGMKPFEYAYADVQVASIGMPIKNLNTGTEYSYNCTPETIQSAFEDKRYMFDKNYHLMDRHLNGLLNI